MSQPEPKKSMREVMAPVSYSDKSHFADILLKIDPRNLIAQTRTVSPFASATLKLISAASQREAIIKNEHDMEFKIKTVQGRMDYWNFYHDGYQISNDGKGRGEGVEVMKLAAIGGADESGAIALNTLNEGAKVINKKGQK